MQMGYVSGLKIARSGASIGLLEFEVTTPGALVPAKYECGTAPLSSKPRALIPPGHALVSFDGTCDAGNGTIVAGGRRRSLLADGGTLASLSAVAAPVTPAAPMPGGALAIKRVNVPCDGLTTFQATPEKALSVTVCAPVSQCDGSRTYETRAPTQFSDRECTMMTSVCDGVTQYAFVPGNSTTDRVCYPLSPECDGKYTFQAVAPTPFSDRVCKNITSPCDGVNTYQTVDPSPLLDRRCSPVAPNCTAGETYQAVAPTPLQNRVCSPVTICDGIHTYERTPPTQLLDRVCSPISAGCDGISTYLVANATLTSNIKCNLTTTCDGKTTYESLPPTPTSDRQCSPVTPCGNGFYMKKPATTKSNTQCAPVTACVVGKTFALYPATNTTDTVCVPVTKCIPPLYQSTPPTQTSDAVCGLTTTCLPDQYEVASPTNTTDRTCSFAYNPIPSNLQAYPATGRYACNYGGSFGSGLPAAPPLAYWYRETPPGWGTTLNWNDIIVCINQQTRRQTGLYISSYHCDHGSSNYQYSPDGPMTLIDFTLVGTTSIRCDFTIAGPNGATWNLFVSQSDAFNNAQDLTVGDNRNTGNAITLPANGPNPPFPLTSTSFDTIAGLALQAKAAVGSDNDPESPAVVEIFGPVCDPTGPSQILSISPLGDPYNISTSANDPNDVAGLQAHFEGYSVNCRNTQAESVALTASVTSTVAFSASLTSGTTITTTTTVESSFKWTPPAGKILGGVETSLKFAEAVAVALSKSQTQTTTVTNTDTIGITLTDNIPPLSNCSSTGHLVTNTLVWQQNVQLNFRSPCSSTIQTRPDVLNVVMAGVVSSTSTARVTYSSCSPPNIDLCTPADKTLPPGPTCASNVQCAASGFQGQCCPKTDGTYMACCAQAVAHQPACGPSSYTNIYDAICPSQTNVYASCCSQPTNSSVFNLP